VQSLRNVETALRAAGAELSDVVHWTITTVQGQDVREGYAAFQQVWGDRTDPPPAISVNVVSAFANPRFLCEITAIAAI
jgi:enamine deaminase RidA (YjgF/YER057c/UK114 family)